jgi:hypothetical protein
MPTGYTEAVASGEVVDFKDYAMRCARAFGAAVTMRDDPPDVPIPDEFEPSQWNAKRLVEVESEIAALQTATKKEIEAMAKSAHDETHRNWQNAVAKKREMLARYTSMLCKAKQFVPPSEDHRPFAEFLIGQLEDSIDHDCSLEFYPEPVKLDAATWKAKRLERLGKDREYHIRHQRDEDERTHRRNKWLKDLRIAIESVYSD